jgi:hypothetical protein
MYFNGGKGANLSFEKFGCRKKFSLLFGLLFIAPVKFVMLEFFVAVGTVIRFLILVLQMIIPSGNNLEKKFDETLVKTFYYVFNMDKT